MKEGKGLKRGKSRERNHILSKAIASFFTWVILPLAAVTLKILRPVLRLGIGELRSDRIGHLAYDTDLYLRRKTLEKQSRPRLELMVCEQPANRQLLSMIKRRLSVSEHPFLLKMYRTARMHSYLKNSDIWIDVPCDQNTFYEFNNINPQLSFTDEEINKGQSELLRMGIKHEDRFVCFQARDKVYLERIHPWGSREDWAYHDYRDADIQSYIRAAGYISSLGFFALRMGYMVEAPIPDSNPKIIDYARLYRSDFMDVYLLAHCKFFLGDTAGLQCVSRAFGIPVAAANWIPLEPRGMTCKHDIFIPKKLWDIARKRFITFREIIESGMDGYTRKDQYEKAGIEIVDNTEDEILCLAREMNERLDKTWAIKDEDEELQLRFRGLFPKTHYLYGFPSRIGTEFLRQYKELLD